jgi:RHS repeat-associated protein
VGGVTTEYVLDVAGGLPEVIVATTGEASTRYVQVQGQVLARQDSGAWTYILPDHLGSVRQLVGSDSQVDLTQSFDPFGVLFETSGSGVSDFGYTGEWWDAEAELLYLRARYYDSYLNRFISKDVFPGHPDSPQSLNGWSYAGNNPVRYTDPSGLIYIEGWGYTCDDPAVVNGMGPDGKPCIPAPPGATLETLNLCSPLYPGDESWKSRSQCNYTPPASVGSGPTPGNLTGAGISPSPPNKCDYHPVRTGLNGYSESAMSSSTILFKPRIWYGKEFVFDFATLEIAEFDVQGEVNPSWSLGADPTSMRLRDISLLDWKKIYAVSYISGFKPNRGVVKDYTPNTVNYAYGVGGGVVASVQIGGQHWMADNLSGLSGTGWWYAGGLSLSIGYSVEYSMQKSSTTPYRVEDLGEVDNSEDAHRFLEALKTWPYPLNYAGLRPGRYAKNGAIDIFKRYAGID